MEEKDINHLKNYLNILNETLKPFEGTNSFSILENFLIEYCFRTYDILIAIDLLANSKLKISELEHPIGILIRSGLHDFIYSQYISNKSLVKNKLDLKKFEEEVREHLGNHFNSIDKNIALKDDFISQDKFKNFGSKEKFKVLGILKEGRDFAKQKKLNYLEAAIDYWESYSKYEHYGAFTNHMYNDSKNNETRILSSLQLLYCHSYFLLLTLIDVNSELIDLSSIDKLGDFALNIN
jgi:hypothetical protein